MGTSSNKHGKVVPQLDDQVIILLRKSGTTFRRINQHTEESHASHCDITHAKVAPLLHELISPYDTIMTPSGNGAILSFILIG